MILTTTTTTGHHPGDPQYCKSNRRGFTQGKLISGMEVKELRVSVIWNQYIKRPVKIQLKALFDGR